MAPPAAGPSPESQQRYWRFSKEQNYWQSAKGSKLLQKVLKQAAFDPHNYQLVCNAKTLDGVDVCTVMRTGGGKTALFFLPVIAILHINSDTGLRGRFNFPLNPAFVVICPTNGLADDMVSFSAMEVMMDVSHTSESVLGWKSWHFMWW